VEEAEATATEMTEMAGLRAEALADALARCDEMHTAAAMEKQQMQLLQVRVPLLPLQRKSACAGSRCERGEGGEPG
jgi:hypothetical protein